MAKKVWQRRQQCLFTVASFMSVMTWLFNLGFCHCQYVLYFVNSRFSIVAQMQEFRQRTTLPKLQQVQTGRTKPQQRVRLRHQRMKKRQERVQYQISNLQKMPNLDIYRKRTLIIKSHRTRRQIHNQMQVEMENLELTQRQMLVQQPLIRPPLWGIPVRRKEIHRLSVGENQETMSVSIQ